jgi:hypothetical protein
MGPGAAMAGKSERNEFGQHTVLVFFIYFLNFILLKN